MMRFPLLLALLAVSAVPALAGSMTCAPNSELDAKSFALWIMPGANPDETPCAARVSPVACETGEAGETRTYASKDGRYSVVLKLREGAVSVRLELSGGASGVSRGAVQLATFPYLRVFYRGIGADAVSVDDGGTRKAIGNVMLIPAENLTPAASCPN